MLANDNYLSYIIRQRRTIHSFQNVKVDDSLIAEAVDVARWAPNHKLTEPWRVILIRDNVAAKIVSINTELVRIKRGDRTAEIKQERWSKVPNWMAITSAIGDSEMRTKENYAATCCFVQNMTLYLWSKDVGVKWSSGPVISSPEVMELLEVNPATEDLIGIFWYGKAAEVKPSSRKRSTEIISSVG